MSASAKKKRTSSLRGILTARPSLFPAVVVNSKALIPDFGGQGDSSTQTLPLSFQSGPWHHSRPDSSVLKGRGLRTWNHLNKQPM